MFGHGDDDDDAMDTDDKMLLLTNEIKAKLCANKHLKIDTNSRYPELKEMTLQQLDEVLFNLRQDEIVLNGGGVAQFMLRSVGNAIGPYIPTRDLADKLATDKELVDNVSSELGRWAFVPNIFVITMRIGNHIYEELERARSRGTPSVPREPTETNK